MRRQQHGIAAEHLARRVLSDLDYRQQWTAPTRGARLPATPYCYDRRGRLVAAPDCYVEPTRRVWFGLEGRHWVEVKATRRIAGAVHICNRTRDSLRDMPMPGGLLVLVDGNQWVWFAGWQLTHAPPVAVQGIAYRRLDLRFACMVGTERNNRFDRHNSVNRKNARRPPRLPACVSAGESTCHVA